MTQSPGAPCGAPEPQQGLSVVETMVILALIAMSLTVSVPALSMLRQRGRTAAGARVLASELHRMRWMSVAHRRGMGLWFERGPQGWQWHVVEDGNGNGLRTAEIRSGVDRKRSGPHRLETRVEGVSLGFPPGAAIPQIPPRRGTIPSGADPVRFGRSDIVAFSPLGRSSSGTLYVTDGADGLFAVVLFGPGTRVRVWRYDRGSESWSL